MKKANENKVCPLLKIFIKENWLLLLWFITIIISFYLFKIKLIPNTVWGALIIVILTLGMVVTYFLYILKTISNELEIKCKNKREFNAIILSIIIIPSVSMTSKLILNWNLSITETFSFMLQIILSLGIILILKYRELI